MCLIINTPKAPRYAWPMLAIGSRTFTCQQHANPNRLYCPAAKHHHPLTGTHCACPRRDDQAELNRVSGYILRWVSCTRCWIHAEFAHSYPTSLPDGTGKRRLRMDMLWCHGAQNIGLSNHKLKSALTCTVWSQCTPVPDGQPDEHHGNSATIRPNERMAR